jgi:membrane protease YdiL (CAAX protease family)
VTGQSGDRYLSKMTRIAWLAVILAVGPFIIKRIILLGYPDDYVVWLTLDYVGRCISLLGVMVGFKSGLIEPLNARAGWFFSCCVLAGLVSAEWAEQSLIYPILRSNLDYLRMYSIPLIANANVRWADLIFGCLFVAVSEELVFRRLMFSVLGSKSFVSVIVLSALIFALVHFTSGVANTISVFIDGVLLGSAFWITRRLSICIIAHYIIDLRVFSGS